MPKFESNPVLAIGLFGLFVGAGSLIIHGALATVETPVLYNHFSSLWATSMLLLASAELLYTNHALTSWMSPSRRRVGTAYFGVCGCCAFIMGVAYAVDTRFDNLVWGLLQALVCATGVFALQRVGAALESKAQFDPERATTPAPRCSLSCCAGCLGGALRCAHVFFMLALATGAIIGAYAATGYAPVGKFVSVQLPGQPQPMLLHYHCLDADKSLLSPSVLGPAPRVWLTSSDAHGTPDFHGLQHHLALQGWRSCSYDPPGYAFSGRLQSGLGDKAQLAAALIAAVEPAGAEIALVAWAGGDAVANVLANRFYPGGTASEAQRAAFSVRALVFVLGYAPGVEWRQAQQEQQLTDAQLESFRSFALSSRVGLSTAILGILCPWGLAPIVAPLGNVPAGFYPKERWGALRTAVWRPELWVNQYWALRAMAQSSLASELSGIELTTAVPIANVICKLSEEQICSPKGRTALSSAECTREVAKAKLEREGAEDKVTKAPGPATGRVVVYSSVDGCNLGLPIDQPQATANGVETALKALI